MCNESYIGVTCHYIHEDWNLKSRVLETKEVPERHTSENIVRNLKSIEREWGLVGKVSGYVSDNAFNMVKAINDMGGDNLVRCTAHSIQLSVNAGLQTALVKDLTGKMRKIVGHFNKSAPAQRELEEVQQRNGERPNKLVQDCITRGNSMHDMMMSVVKHRMSINNCLSEDAKTDHLFISSNKNSKMKALIELLEPFKTCTEVLGGDKYVTGSVAHRLIKSLLNSVLPQHEGCFH